MKIAGRVTAHDPRTTVHEPTQDRSDLLHRSAGPCTKIVNMHSADRAHDNIFQGVLPVAVVVVVVGVVEAVAP